MLNMKKGFTLVELLIVVVIVAILASLTIPRFIGQTERAVVAEATQMLAAIRQGEVAYELEHPGTWGTIAQLDIDVPASTLWTYTAAAADGSGTATRDAGDPDFGGDTIILNADGTWGAGTHDLTPTN